ncbi:follistatin-A isoform X1 [Nematolebias whitei]|uniref:follistatin-A isoform X1 n=1 Tax=Nematolebias whitei TaxID=451745 RepID=UPI001896BD8D|nr:follistatin-A isoform X1 [Nematolebias whitei]
MFGMLRRHLNPGIFFFLLWLCLLLEHQKVQAGNCWLQQGKNGRCQVLYMPGMSREECCRSQRLGTSWTEEDVPNTTLFRWMIFNGGAPNCIPCKESCENVDCGPGKTCKINRKGKPRCVCAPDCSNITWKGPVCGTDGKTYKDECALLRAKCKTNPDLDVQYQGKCKSKSNIKSPISYYFLLFISVHFIASPETCRQVLCPGTSNCVVDQTNNAYCVTCNRICPPATSPDLYLCGNDGITYQSACHLRKATCLLGRSIGVAYDGKCIKAKSCQAITCSAGKKCLWDNRTGRGRCSVCVDSCSQSRSSEAVCASNNTTYPSECAMKQAACSMGVLLEVKHSGSCNSITEDQEDDEEDEDSDYKGFVHLSSELDG